MIVTWSSYLLASSLVLGVWYLGYKLLFAKNSFHNWNRVYLLLGIGMSVALPFLPSTVNTGEAATAWLSPVVVGFDQSVGAIASTSLIDTGYKLIVIALLIKVLISFFMAMRNQSGGSYSFFGRIVVEPGLTQDQAAQIYAHEKAHQQLGHSFDVLLLEIYKAVHWINPLVWFYSASIKKIHEFQADQRVAQLDIDLHEYSVLLLSSTLKLQPSALVNRFHQPSILKQRIIMLNTKSRNTRKYTYLFSIPLIALALTLGSCSKDSASGNPDQVVTGKLADKQAEFPGGMEAMYAWMGENLTYPENLKEEGVEGKLFVKFVIESDGSLSSFNIERSLNPQLDKLTVEALTKMPKWSPAIKDGAAVAQEMVLPVMYKID